MPDPVDRNEVPEPTGPPATAAVLAAEFEQQRPRLRSIAFRMLGSHSDADDAVQEAWLRLQRNDTSEVDNLAGWLTVVVSRVCLDLLRSRSSHAEQPFADPGEAADANGPGHDQVHDQARTPEDHTVEADAVGAALLVVLETLNPQERLAFVLHDLFGMPFEEIAPIVDRSPAAARQLASRARRRVQGVRPSGERSRQRQVVDAFLAASRDGDFGRLLQLLDPEVELRADPRLVAATRAATAKGLAAPHLDTVLQGADAVARIFAGRAQTAQPALIDGVPGAAWAPGGRPRTVFAMQIIDGRITRLEAIGDPAQLAEMDIVLEPAGG